MPSTINLLDKNCNLEKRFKNALMAHSLLELEDVLHNNMPSYIPFYPLTTCEIILGRKPSDEELNILIDEIKNDTKILRAVVLGDNPEVKTKLTEITNNRMIETIQIIKNLSFSILANEQLVTDMLPAIIDLSKDSFYIMTLKNENRCFTQEDFDKHERFFVNKLKGTGIKLPTEYNWTSNGRPNTDVKKHRIITCGHNIS